MQIEFFQTVGDFRAAYRLHELSSRAGYLRYVLRRVLLPVLSILIIGYTVYTSYRQDDALQPASYALLAILLVVVCSPALRYYAIGKQFNQMRPARWRDQRVRVELSDDSIISSIPGLAEAKYSWNSVYKFAQDEKITMIYLTKINFLFIPTKTFTTAERAQLDELITRHGVKR